MFGKTKSLYKIIEEIKKLIMETSFFQFSKTEKYEFIKENKVTNESVRYFQIKTQHNNENNIWMTYGNPILDHFLMGFKINRKKEILISE